MESIGRATTRPWFEDEIRRMLDLDIKAHAWLTQRDASQWCRSHFNPHCKCDMLLNNIREVFNISILLARIKSVLAMLERIRMY